MLISERDQSIIRGFLKDYPVKRAYVFGSYARGDADAESDLDLLVELDYSQHIGLQFVHMQLELSRLLSKPVDLVSTEGLSPFLAPEIHQDKMLIYGEAAH